MDASAFLTDIIQAPWYHQQIVHTEHIPPRQAATGVTRVPIHPSLQATIERQGLWPLYAHQAQALDALQDGANVVISTPSASGKSLCYNLAVLDALLRDRTTRAICVYPAKALAQDQLRGLKEMGRGLAFRAAIYDGDTPGHERSSIRRSTQILLTNPDMLHLGILPNHRAWSRLIRGLRYVVLDEAHVYRGVFGSHVANVVRRLRRLCSLYGSAPQFILCSATIGNPGELARRLTGLSCQVIDRDGAPYGGKRFVFWNPPTVEAAVSPDAPGRPLDGGIPPETQRMVRPGKGRRSTNIDAATLFAELVSRSVRTITFVRTRRVAELVYLYAREQLDGKRPALSERISPYRATYLPEDRRRIERALFQGELMGVATTNALELGIDVGSLDASVITGYPGSVSSTWQQAGRSGRRTEESLAVLVAQDNPLDQYVIRHPETFFGRPVENALVSPENPYIAQPHLMCAAYESPLTSQDEELFGSSYLAHLNSLQERGLVRKGNGAWYATPAIPYPAETVNIRSTSSDNYLVVVEGSGVILETVDESSAFQQLHQGAVYLHQGEPYLVVRLDLESRTAHVAPSDGEYYTQTRDLTDIRILDVLRSKVAGGVEVCLGNVEVTNYILGFKKRRPFTEEIIGEEYLDLPPRRFSTVALWFYVPQGVLDNVKVAPLDLAGGLRPTPLRPVRP